MIAVDTSTWIAFLQEDGGEDGELPLIDVTPGYWQRAGEFIGANAAITFPLMNNWEPTFDVTPGVNETFESRCKPLADA